MTRTDALPLARQIAAGICAADGCSENFCTYMRDGSYDDSREVMAAQAAIVVATQNAERMAKPGTVVGIAA